MKVLKFIILGLVLFISCTLQAQVAVRVKIGSPPLWGPYGYNEARYYYLPDVEAYYDVQSSMFIYNNGGVWVHRTYLPRRYRDYDLYGGYKVVMTDYHGNTPYTYFKEYKTKYAKGYHGQSQKTIGERHGNGNFQEKSVSKGYSNKEVNQRNGKSARHGNNKKKNRGNEGGNGKEK